MKMKIYYFTGNGNSLKKQQERFKKADEKISKIIQALKEKRSEYNNKTLSFLKGLTKTGFYKKNIRIMI